MTLDELIAALQEAKEHCVEGSRLVNVSNINDNTYIGILKGVEFTNHCLFLIYE